MTKKTTYHIPVLVILSVLFLAILLISTSQIGVNYQYTFKDEIIAKDGQIQVGELSITNTWILPARVKVKTLYGCILNESSHQLYVSYNSPFLNYNYYRNSIDVSPKSENKYQINLEYYPVFDRESSTKSVREDDFEIVLFEGNDQYGYGFCNEPNLNNAVKVIKVKVENDN